MGLVLNCRFSMQYTCETKKYIFLRILSLKKWNWGNFFLKQRLYNNKFNSSVVSHLLFPTKTLTVLFTLSQASYLDSKNFIKMAPCRYASKLREIRKELVNMKNNFPQYLLTFQRQKEKINKNGRCKV